MDEIHEWRDQYGADLVSLHVSRDVLNGDEGTAGLAYTLNSLNSEYDWPAWAFSAIVVEQYHPYLLIHEIGHNLGCSHSKYDLGSNGLFDYSHGWIWDSYCSVMSYTQEDTYKRVGVFSNPDILDHGLPTGDPKGG